MPVEEPVEQRFLFGGGAVAFGGRINRPENCTLKTVAATYLPITGGLSEDHLEGPDCPPYHYKDFFSFTAARSRAKGDPGNDGENDIDATTVVESRLEGLKIDASADPAEKTPRRIFEAKILDAHLESAASRKNRKQPISFRSLKAVFGGITLTTVTGQGSSTAALEVLTETEIFNQHDTKAALKDASNSKEFRAHYVHHPGIDLPGLLERLFGKHEIGYSKEGPIVATFVTGLKWVGEAPEGTSILHNRLTVAGLGKIYFGEVIIDEASRCVSLLRFELGSTTGADGVAVQVDSRGIHYPPGT
jgi:hypothetical protein